MDNNTIISARKFMLRALIDKYEPIVINAKTQLAKLEAEETTTNNEETNA